MSTKLRYLGFTVLGACLGLMISLALPALAQRDAAGLLPVDELRIFTEVLGRIKSDYVESVDDKKLFANAIAGMVTGLDPHSAYLDQDAYREMQVGTRGEFGGLGIEVGMEDGLVKVVSANDDSPATRAGIKPGDLITKLDEISVHGMTLNDAIKLMRGKPNTRITLTLVRKGEDKPLVITLTRGIIKIQSVKAQLLEPGYGYIRVTQFRGHTGESLANSIQALFKQNAEPMKGIVLDLRNDPGGLLDEAVAVSAAFLPRNSLVVYTDGRTEDARMRLTASPENYLRGRGKDDYLSQLPAAIKNVPLVVLVNSSTASASEIVAGALQDHRRAVIMGTPTFGKGSVQTILPFANGTALKLTTSRYYTPHGRSIQAKGIVPDIALDDGLKTDARPRMREADLTKHLPNNREDGLERIALPLANAFSFTPAPRPKDIDEKTTRPAPGAVVAENDYELSQAIAFLKRPNALSASADQRLFHTRPGD